MKKSILFCFLIVPVLSYSQISSKNLETSNNSNLKPDENLILKGTIISFINQQPLPFISVSLIQNRKIVTQGQTDLDGHYWEVAFNPFAKLGSKGEFQWNGVELSSDK